MRVVVRDIKALGGAAAYVADRADLMAAAKSALDEFGRIDCWISNAGVAIYAPLMDTPEQQHRRLFDTNYFGTVNSAAVAVPLPVEMRGTFVALGSIAGEMPPPVMGAHTASKHALHAFAASLRIELKNSGSPGQVSLIKPSGMTTPIADHAANHQDGAARIPPPPYDPRVAVDAVLYAATHRVRDLTVGGVGRGEVLFFGLFPRIFERLAPAVIPFLRIRG